MSRFARPMFFLLLAALVIPFAGCYSPSWRSGKDGSGLVWKALATEDEVDAVKDGGLKEADALRTEIAAAEKRARDDAVAGDIALRADLEQADAAGSRALLQAISEGKSAQDAELARLRASAEIARAGVEAATIRAAEAERVAGVAHSLAVDEAAVRKTEVNAALTEIRANKIDAPTLIAEIKKGLPTGTDPTTAIITGAAGIATTLAGIGVANARGKRKGKQEGALEARASGVATGPPKV